METFTLATKPTKGVSPMSRWLLVPLALCLLLQPSAEALGAASNAITPGAIHTDATFEHIGVLWEVQGDANLNSHLTLEFRRQGETTWHPGAPAVRAYPTLTVDGSPLNLNHLAASALFLQPGQTYELRLTLTDPDGGGTTQMTTATTRTELQAAPAGRQRYVVPGSGGGAGSAGNPFKGLAAAASDAQHGDIFNVAAGTYSPFQLLHSGSAGQPIVFRGPSVGTAIIDGAGTDRGVVTLGDYGQTISYVIVEGFTLQNGAWGVDAQNDSNIAIRHNVLRNVDDGVVNRRDGALESNQTISDNVITGRTPWPGTGIPEAEGIDLRGTGNVVAHNRVRSFGDCISVVPQTGPSYGNDVFGNDVAYCVDDGIEIDYNRANVRAWRNRVMNSRMGVSVQPILGGPAYIFRNEFFNLESEPIKMHNDTTGYWVVHNTGVKNDNGQGDDGAMWRNAVFRNNVFLGTRYAFEFTTVPDEGFRDFDYDAWGTTRAIGSPTDPYFKWNGLRYSRLPDLQAIGVEVHGLNALITHLVNPTLPAAWNVDVAPGSRDLRLAAGAPEINAGAVLTNFNDPFVTDSHPDLGAFEYGQAAPAYGPRAAVPDLSASTKQVSPLTPSAGDTLTYTLTLRNLGVSAPSACLTDTLPAQVQYAGNLWMSTGVGLYSGGVVTWSGSVTSDAPVTIHFNVTVDPALSSPSAIVNTAYVNDGAGQVLTRTASAIADGYAVYLPVVGR
jgi:uncharacterized repeat protein (TIGR01451 family)